MHENKEKLAPELEPVYEDENIMICQDMEWPIPAFYIATVKKHISSVADIEPAVAGRLFEMIAHTRRGMRELFGIEKAQLYHEEKLKAAHVHFWLLPLYGDVMEKHNIFPKVYEGNVKDYIDLFNYQETKEKIMFCNQKMRAYLKDK